MSDAGTQALEAKRLGEYKIAERLYLQAQLEGDLLATTNLGIMYWELGEILAARDQFNLAAQSGYLAALWDLGNMYSQLGFVSAAFSAWERSLPDQPQAFQTLMAMNAQRGQLEVALSWAERGIAAGIDLLQARDALSNMIQQDLRGIGEEAELIAQLLAQTTQLTLEELEIDTQKELCELRWQIAERRPLGPGLIDEMFGRMSIATSLGILRPASEVIPPKGQCWALAADAYAILLGLLIEVGADSDEIVTAAKNSSLALQESLAIDSRKLSEREEIIVENLANVLSVLNDPLGVLYGDADERSRIWTLRNG